MIQDYDIAGQIPAGTPTLRDIVNRGLAFGVDKLSLVREPLPGREAGILVVMINDAAVRAVGPMLREFAVEADASMSHDKSQVLKLEPDTSLAWFFKWLEETGQCWAFGQVPCSGCKVIVAGFLGTPLCARVAHRLTAYGVPTRLN